MGRNYYMVRAMDSSEKSLGVFVQNEVIAVGWSQVDFSSFANDYDKLRGRVEEEYYSQKESRPTPSALGRKLAQIQRFAQIKHGDYVIVPYHSSIILATATDEKIYSQQDIADDLANQIRVKYVRTKSGELRKVPRSELLEGLQRRLRMPGSTVLDLSKFSEELDRIFAEHPTSFTEIYSENIDKQIENFKSTLLSSIVDGETRVKTGGLGFEELVKELLECEGYDEVKILPKTKYLKGADADIVAIKRDPLLGEQKFLLQVKHHSGVTDDYGVRQLIAARETGKEVADYYILISSASIDPKAQELADAQDIYCMDGYALRDWIYANCSKLSHETRARLNISLVPQVV